MGARLFQFEVKHEGKQLVVQRLAIASGTLAEDVLTLIEVDAGELPLAWASVSDPVDQHTKEHMQHLHGTPKTPLRHSRRKLENHRRDTTNTDYLREPHYDLS